MPLVRVLHVKAPFSISTACKVSRKDNRCRRPSNLGLELETLIGVLRLSTLGLNVDGSFLSYGSMSRDKTVAPCSPRLKMVGKKTYPKNYALSLCTCPSEYAQFSRGICIWEKIILSAF